eukprot:5579665-Amphidinium_carterae.2
MTEVQSTTAGGAGRGRSRTLQGENHALALQAASLLLTRPWLASLPLIDEGAATSLQEGMYTEVAVLAVRWPGPASGPVAFETVTVQLHDPGSATILEEHCEVAIMYQDGTFLKD